MKNKKDPLFHLLSNEPSFIPTRNISFEEGAERD